MFNSAFGTEISWLLPAAAILLVAGLIARGTLPRTDRIRASLILWGGWLVVTAIVLSFMEGTVHPYYAVALAPAIGAVVAVGGRETIARHRSIVWRVVTAATVCVTAIWGFRLLSTTAGSWLPWLRWVTVVLAILGAMAYVAFGAWEEHRIRRMATAGLIVGSIASLGGTSAWTFATAAQGHNGSIPVSGPSVAGSRTGGMGGGAPSGGSAPSGMTQGGTSSGAQGSNTQGSNAQGSSAQGGSSSNAQGSAPSGEAPSGEAPSGAAPAAPGANSNSNSSSNSSGSSSEAGSAQSGSSQAGSAQAGSSEAGSSSSSTQQAAGGGSMGSGSSNNAALVKLLNATSSRWSAAVVGDQSAAGYILSTNTAVMSIGGWSGTDNNVTLAQFEQYVKSGDIHYFIASGDGAGGGPGGNSGSSAQITAWVKAHFKATTVGGVTVYDLTQQTS